MQTERKVKFDKPRLGGLKMKALRIMKKQKISLANLDLGGLKMKEQKRCFDKP